MQIEIKMASLETVIFLLKLKSCNCYISFLFFVFFLNSSMGHRVTRFDLPNKKGKLATCLMVKKEIFKSLIKLRVWGRSGTEEKHDELEKC